MCRNKFSLVLSKGGTCYQNIWSRAKTLASLKKVLMFALLLKWQVLPGATHNAKLYKIHQKSYLTLPYLTLPYLTLSIHQ